MHLSHTIPSQFVHCGYLGNIRAKFNITPSHPISRTCTHTTMTSCFYLSANGLKYVNYMGFTTKDKDNDLNAIGNCAHQYPGGWWFRFCLSSNLNGLYFHHADISSRGVTWNSFSNYRSLKFSEMKIRSRV